MKVWPIIAVCLGLFCLLGMCAPKEQTTTRHHTISSSTNPSSADLDEMARRTGGMSSYSEKEMREALGDFYGR